MTPAIADPVRPAPGPLAGVAAPTPKAAAKPGGRFDQVLARRRESPKPARADATPPAKPAETSAADSNDTPEPADETADETAGATPVKKADARPLKKPGRPTDAADDTDAGIDAETPSDAADAGSTTPVAAVDSVGPPADDADAETDEPAADKLADEPTAAAGPTPDVDPGLLAQAAAAAPPPADAVGPVATDDAATAGPTAGPLAAVGRAASAAPKAAPPNGASAGTPLPSEAGSEAAGERAVVRPHAVAADTVAGADGDGVDRDLAAALPPAKADVDKPDAAAAVDVSALQPVVHDKAAVARAALPPVPTPAAAPPRPVAEANVDHIVTSVRGELLTKGGTMDIRLDPPSLGTINISISVDDGVLSASLRTTSDEATRLLGHNLTQLKTALESAGVSVERIQVKQAAPAEASSGPAGGGTDPDSRQRPDAGQDQSGGREQQRREMLQRMWARVAGDPLDLVA